MQLDFFRGLQVGVWWVGVPGWVFGIIDRSIAGFGDGFLSAIELMQLFVAATFFLAWVALKPLR
ncbi:MAG: hypothetical protein RBJ76_13565 [Stenomitos frigidus ULC029]